jgi:prolyl-tRNA editing enzyme YbaK/EbsC (Cys-tRNA(Pro) deacylase)
MPDAVTELLLALLATGNADFEVLRHAPVRTSAEAAAIRGTPEEQGAKALVFQADARTVLLVVPGDRRMDNRAFKRAYGVKDLRLLPSEDLIAQTGLEPGAVPPFGSLLGFPTYADERLLSLPRIAFNAGSRSVSVVLATADYVRLEQPTVGRFASEDART